MNGWNFPPLEEFDYIGAIEALAGETIRPVRDQHVVSKVVLKGFAAPSRTGRGWQLARYDKNARRELDPKGLNACGKISGFVQFASGSAEQTWNEVETRLGAAIRAAEVGGLHGGSEASVIKDAIALHLVRSSHYRRVHERSVLAAIHGTRLEALSSRRSLIEQEFYRRFGIDAAGTEALDLVLRPIFERWEEYDRIGALLRVSLERAFFQVRSALAELSIEVLHASPGSEFIISDAPAFTFRREIGGSMALRMAIGDSHGIAMPVTKYCFVAVGPEPKEVEASSDMMHQLNCVQVRLAERQLYYRPGNTRARMLIETALAVID